MPEVDGLAMCEIWRRDSPDRLYDIHSRLDERRKCLVVLTDEDDHITAEEGEEGSVGPHETVAVAIRKWKRKKAENKR